MEKLRKHMTIKKFAFIILALSLCLVLTAVAYTHGGVRHLTDVNALIMIVGLSFPFAVLWGAGYGAKGTIVPLVTIAVSIIFILLDISMYIGPLSRLDGSARSIVIAMLASLQIMLPLIMVGCAIVSCANRDGNKPGQPE